MVGAGAPSGWNWKSKSIEILHYLGVGKKPPMADEKLIHLIRRTPRHVLIKAMEHTLTQYPPESEAADSIRDCLEATRNVSTRVWDAFRFQSKVATG